MQSTPSPEFNLGFKINSIQQAAGSKPGDRDPETFDDTDFYSTLLKEFLESTEAPALTSQKYAVR